MDRNISNGAGHCFLNPVAPHAGSVDRNIIKSVFDREMVNAGFNSTAFLSWAKRNDIIITDNGKRTKKARITGSATNCVCIRKNLNEFEPEKFEEVDMFPL